MTPDFVLLRDLDPDQLVMFAEHCLSPALEKRSEMVREASKRTQRSVLLF